MLSNKLQATLPSVPDYYSYVGGRSVRATTTATSHSYSLTTLTDGTDSRPSAGDIIVGSISFSGSADRNIQCTSSGYTELADLNSVSLLRNQLAVYYKISNGTETAVSFSYGESVRPVFQCQVWRPLGVGTEILSNSTIASAGLPDPPIISNSIHIGSRVLAFVSQTNLVFGAASYSNSIKTSSSGAYDPPPIDWFGFSSGNSAPSCSVTVCLNPII